VIPNLADSECVPYNLTTYESTTGDQFYIFCDGVFQSSADLYFTIASDFYTCIDGCALWNKNASVPCVGVSFDLGVYGPEGEGKGSWCMYRWGVSEDSFNYVKGWSTAQLIVNGNSSVVRPLESYGLELMHMHRPRRQRQLVLLQVRSLLEKQ
jgi:hypothetical protein